MEGQLSIRFEKRELGEITDYLFKGLRVSEDVAYKLGYVLGDILGLNEVMFEAEDEDGVGYYRMSIDDIVHYDDLNEDSVYDRLNDECCEEIEDNNCDN